MLFRSLIHFFGIVHLAIFLGGDLRVAFGLGSIPFLVGDLLKALVAASIVAGWPKGTAPANV